ncbi:hypothetical protein COZ39_01450 [Candidatus Roizmanbacteria bacterium CG_4_10_14_3_um_filter_33_21]|uniref:PDZ domain-containing protein n=1 Tax=Candidatus Roizmanbacteria bacterium CG_4_10_14_3_um_filter_33_21 TaxID=1974830 RepID=A0A2M7M0L5_9BACT|nr:MAG: hypothetical protein COZ39_01450 [Candidatus Roizmanbacteria bacterium CG_4_10_14_3_um_filter_33_21]
MKPHRLTNILLGLSLVIFLFGTGYKIGEYRANQTKIELPNYNIVNAPTNISESKNTKNIDFSLFWQAWERVEQKFVDKKKLEPQKMFYGAIKGMVASLEDPYTFFLTPDENKQSKDDLGGKFEGIGAQLGLKDNRVIVIAPLKDSPAEKVGVVAGDYINQVDGNFTKSMTLNQTVSKIRGEKGTKVKLIIERGKKEMEKTIIRDVIKITSVELSKEKLTECQNNCVEVAYLKLNQFGENTNDEWDVAVELIAKQWKNKEINGMVLDLRNNPGGYLESSVHLAGEFLPFGTVVVKQESTMSENRTYKVLRAARLPDVPVIVLINRGSASASEILSGALRDHKRAKLVGEKSFGKGSVQEALDLDKGAGLHVTVAKWILPNGDWIMGKGIEPDIKIENKITEGNTLTKQNDSQLQKAIELLVK